MGLYARCDAIYTLVAINAIYICHFGINGLFFSASPISDTSYDRKNCTVKYVGDI